MPSEKAAVRPIEITLHFKLLSLSNGESHPKSDVELFSHIYDWLGPIDVNEFIG